MKLSAKKRFHVSGWCPDRQKHKWIDGIGKNRKSSTSLANNFLTNGKNDKYGSCWGDIAK